MAAVIAGDLQHARRVRDDIVESGVLIYDEPATEATGLFFTPLELQALLSAELVGRPDLGGLPVRTRSKVAKTLVCEALGYEPPLTFARVNPRLRHANVDVYCQEASNLQIWNEEVDAARRYVILIIKAGLVADVKVIAGADLAAYDTTGTLTSKFQANRIDEGAGSRLVSSRDTGALFRLVAPSSFIPRGVSPVALPERGGVLDVVTVYERLLPLVGRTFDDPGLTQERNRGTVVHRVACELLGLDGFGDTGQFPDVLSQVLEVKLQLARTIDLGLERPDGATPVASTNGLLSVADMRYAIFYGDRYDHAFTVMALVVTTGAEFFTEFRLFGGMESNKKLQLKLPSKWFAQ